MKRVQMLWPDELVERVDGLVGSRGRTAFTVRAVEAALVPPTVVVAPSSVEVPDGPGRAYRYEGGPSWRPVSSLSAKAGVRPIPKRGS